MIRNFEKLRHAYFERTIGKSVMREPRWHSRLNDAFLNWAMRVKAPDSDVIPGQAHYERSSDNPLTQNYFESTIGLVTHPGGIDPWLVELARLTVPASKVAVVKSFEQVFIHSDVEGDTVFSASNLWGNPFSVSSVAAIDDIEWLWRIEKTEGAVAPFVNLTNPVQVPGIPHPEIASMHDLWFPAASSPSQNIHITIGGGMTLRLFSLVRLNAAYDIQIAAKVRGFHVSEFDAMTKLAIRSIW